MRRSAAAIAAVVALCSLGGASAADVDWTALPYFDAPNMRELVSTDSTWSGSKAVDAGHFNLQPSTSWPKVKRQWIWSATCGPAAQRVVFSKTFLAPGEPLDGRLDLTYG